MPHASHVLAIIVIVVLALFAVFNIRALSSSSSDVVIASPKQQHDGAAVRKCETDGDDTHCAPKTREMRRAVAFRGRRVTVGDFNVSLVGGASAVDRRRRNICNRAGASVYGGASAEDVALPQCPASFHLYLADAAASAAPAAQKKNIDHDHDWIRRKYELYAQRCKSRDGVMWAQLTRAKHDRLAKKVADLIFALSTIKTDFKLFDFGAGCGVGVKFFSKYCRERKVPFKAVGIDLIQAAVDYASRDVAGPDEHIRFCRADGTNLDWVPSSLFDAVTGFGALLHVPQPLQCRTVSELLRIVKRGGLVWAGYIDDADTVMSLAACNVSCGAADGADDDVKVEVLVVSERTWFRGLLPRANAKRSPKSIVWRKV